MLYFLKKGAIRLEVFERIRELRKNYLKLSQEQFGEKLGVSRSVIKNIELDLLARPEQKEPLLKLICKEFGVNEEWLRTGEGDIFFHTEETRLNYLFAKLDASDDEFKKEFISYILEIDESDWDVIGKHIKKLAEIYNKNKK